MPKLIVICGPTASGKTALGVALAKALDGEVVSADSMQIYRGMDIGTAKPTPAETRGVPHHMIDVADPTEDFSVARYVDLASAAVDDIAARGKQPIVVGGTGLYIDNLIAGRQFAPLSGLWRDRLKARVATEGLAALYRELETVDPRRAAQVHPNDEKRILRALEIWHETGRPMSDHDAHTQAIPPKYEALRIGLSFADRAHLRRRIDLRVDEMMARGLADEVAALLAAGVPPQATAMQAIGYKELTSALRGERPLAEAAEEIKLRSRQYAKRQLSWFRRTEGVHWHLWGEKPNLDDCLRDSTKWLEENGI